MGCSGGGGGCVSEGGCGAGVGVPRQKAVGDCAQRSDCVCAGARGGVGKVRRRMEAQTRRHSRRSLHWTLCAPVRRREELGQARGRGAGQGQGARRQKWHCCVLGGCERSAVCCGWIERMPEAMCGEVLQETMCFRALRLCYATVSIFHM